MLLQLKATEPPSIVAISGITLRHAPAPGFREADDKADERTEGESSVNTHASEANDSGPARDSTARRFDDGAAERF